MAVGNKHLGYKEALNAIERQSPGTKLDFYFGFLQRASSRFLDDAVEEQAGLRPCSMCGAPSAGEVCAFCRLSTQAREAAPVALRGSQAGS